MTLSPQQLDTELTRVLAEEPVVQLALLFGSRVTGRARAASDVDVAVYLDGPADEAVLFPEVQRIEERLERSLKADVDLIVLNTAAPAIAAEALRGGRLLLGDERLYLELLCEKTREAEDLREWTMDLLRLRRQWRKEAGK